MAELLKLRRSQTAERIQKLLEELIDAEKLCSGVACVYATGSFGRGKASSHSDLDLFIVGKGTRENRSLRRLDEIVVKADLIEATQTLGILEFSGDGEYLNHYTVTELVDTLGKREDDVNNTFTARLLLLLESYPLLGESVYHEVTDQVIGAYWKDYKDHKNDFMPAFLANDILRMWRTFCVNYEARTSNEPDEKKAKRKLKNYKLKHSRLLTCYSALLYLLAVFNEEKSVSPNHAAQMIRMTPTLRLDWILAKEEFSAAHKPVRELITKYEDFLEATDASEAELVKTFMDREAGRRLLSSANSFGDTMFEAMTALGKNNKFHRLLVV